MSKIQSFGISLSVFKSLFSQVVMQNQGMKRVFLNSYIPFLKSHPEIWTTKNSTNFFKGEIGLKDLVFIKKMIEEGVIPKTIEVCDALLNAVEVSDEPISKKWKRLYLTELIPMMIEGVRADQEFQKLKWGSVIKILASCERPFPDLEDKEIAVAFSKKYSTIQALKEELEELGSPPWYWKWMLSEINTKKPREWSLREKLSSVSSMSAPTPEVLVGMCSTFAELLEGVGFVLYKTTTEMFGGYFLPEKYVEKVFACATGKGWDIKTIDWGEPVPGTKQTYATVFWDILKVESKTNHVEWGMFQTMWAIFNKRGDIGVCDSTGVNVKKQLFDWLEVASNEQRENAFGSIKSFRLNGSIYKTEDFLFKWVAERGRFDFFERNVDLEYSFNVNAKEYLFGEKTLKEIMVLDEREPFKGISTWIHAFNINRYRWPSKKEWTLLKKDEALYKEMLSKVVTLLFVFASGFTAAEASYVPLSEMGNYLNMPPHIEKDVLQCAEADFSFAELLDVPGCKRCAPFAQWVMESDVLSTEWKQLAAGVVTKMLSEDMQTQNPRKHKKNRI